MLVIQVFQMASNCTGDCQNWGNRLNIACLSCISSAKGSPGLSLAPYTVHLASTPSPKKHSLASFTANAPAVPTFFSFLYFSTTASTGWNFDLSMAAESSAMPFFFCDGSGSIGAVKVPKGDRGD